MTTAGSQDQVRVDPPSREINTANSRSDGMRVCRFGFDEMVLTGFYADDHVIPIDQAAEAYSRDMGVELLAPLHRGPARPAAARRQLLRSRLRAVRLDRTARPASRATS